MISIEDLILNTPLYKPEEFSIQKDIEQLYQLKYFQGTIDFHCSSCEAMSTFLGVQRYPFINARVQRLSTYEEFKTHHASKSNQPAAAEAEAENYILKDPFYPVYLECTRNRLHTAIFLFRLSNGRWIEKVGQYPSLATQYSETIKKYRPVLSKAQYIEFNRAVGLTTHGVGIGAFVYLRRILENLIWEAKEVAKMEIENWSEEAFVKGRMKDRINLLEAYLPDFLTSNKVVYGILSKGVHELTEEECLTHFPVMKTAIELILEEKLYHLEQEKKKKEAQRALSRIQQDLSNKPSD